MASSRLLDNDDGEPLAVEAAMMAILATMAVVLISLEWMQTPSAEAAATTSSLTKGGESDETPSWSSLFLPCPKTEPSKYAYEMYCWYYTPVWIGAFGCIVAFQWYESFTARDYLVVCGGLALPFALQPFLYPQGVIGTALPSNPDASRPLLQRYSLKANVWIATYAFIGNYWYTHYFYSVLQAKYTMPSHRINDVPIAMFLATHFYFSTYHAFSNACLRYVVRAHGAGWMRSAMFVYVVVFLSYFTAFMETLTISSFPYYSFEDRDAAYVYGSAFYGIYFLVSFPAFYFFDCHVDDGQEITRGGSTNGGTKYRPLTLWDSFVSSCGYGMIILTSLDFVRLYLGIPLVIGGVAFAQT